MYSVYVSTPFFLILPPLQILSALLSHGESIPNFDDLFSRVVLFLRESSQEQLRYATSSYSELCHRLTDELIRRGVPMQGLSPLLSAVPRLQQTSAPKGRDAGCQLPRRLFF